MLRYYGKRLCEGILPGGRNIFSPLPLVSAGLFIYQKLSCYRVIYDNVVLRLPDVTRQFFY